MKKILISLNVLLLMATAIWSCMKEPAQSPDNQEFSLYQLVLDKVDLASVVIPNNNSTENAIDRDLGTAPQGCDCRFQILSAQPPSGAGYWLIGLDYDLSDPQPEWLLGAQGAYHDFQLTATNCFDVIHAIPPAHNGTGVSITWRVTCKGKSVTYTYAIGPNDAADDDRIRVCLGADCGPYLLLDE